MQFQLRDQITDKIRPILDEALNQGFHVFLLRPSGVRRDPINFAYVCLDVNESFAIVNGGSNRLEEPTLAAPIKPSREYGSSVLVDYDGSVYGAVQALRDVCETEIAVVRFCGSKRNELGPVVANYGHQVLDSWPSGGASNFVELTPTNIAREVVSA